MARFVKVFQIQRVVPHLIERCCVEIRLSNLELKNKEDVLDEQDAINAFPKSRDDVLEIQASPPVDIAARLEVVRFARTSVELGFLDTGARCSVNGECVAEID